MIPKDFFRVMRPETCDVVTKGTLTEGESSSSNPDASYLMAISENFQSYHNQEERHIFGVCMVDVVTSKIILGQFSDDSDCSNLCCILSEFRPKEIVIPPLKMLSLETERVLVRDTRNPVINELAPVKCWGGEKTLSYVNCIYKQINSQTNSVLQGDDISCGLNSSNGDGGEEYLPDVLAHFVNAGGDGYFALSALGGALFYLKKAFPVESLLRLAKFELLPCYGLCDCKPNPYAVLDARAFENSRNGDSSRTLYAQLNHCVTASDKRLLKRWLARPLCSADSICARQDTRKDIDEDMH